MTLREAIALARAGAWRCLFHGHLWGDERREYEDAGYPVHVETWRECLRPECERFERLWSIYDAPVHSNCRCTAVPT